MKKLFLVALVVLMFAADSRTQTGKASWYGAQYHGKRTSKCWYDLQHKTGVPCERFDMHAMTAAHKTLPFDTMVTVCRVDNDKCVVVRINDRGPFVRGRVIDLSKRAAQKIDMVHEGVVQVRLTW